MYDLLCKSWEIVLVFFFNIALSVSGFLLLMTSFCLNSMLQFLWGKLIDYVCDICTVLIEFIW